MGTEFTPLAASIGGVLIGLASALLLVANGRIAGITGILDGAVFWSEGKDRAWRGAFLLGLLFGALGWLSFQGGAVDFGSDRSIWLVVGAGLLVGFGTKLANGCTSGHGVCGNARLSKRSLVATVTFMAVGAATVAALGGAA